MVRVLRGLLAAVVVTAFAAAPAWSEPRDDAVWTEHYFPSEDGLTMLHADVLRPKGLGDKDKTPVILTVSPYMNHAGSVPTDGYSPLANSGPNERFYDFLDLSNILKKSYTYVMVDLPGTGGSGGCNDWGGVREQEAVKAAVEWAASQPWSTGRVGLIGKSYDGWTGLMGMAQKPKGLAAVVAMEPVYSGYRYLYNNGVRFLNSVATPAIFQAVDAMPGSQHDSPEYHVTGAPQVWCYGVNMALQQQDEESADFWAERNLLKSTKRSKVPLFLTQGFLETNTKQDAAFDFFNGLKGPNRAWFGQFDHCRAWETQSACGGGGNTGPLAVGRDGFISEVMRFFDHYVKGVSLGKAPVHKDPSIAVQDNLGRYRGEKSWPPADAKLWWSKLQAGTYDDDGENTSTGTSAGNGIWSFSQPLTHDVWLAGEPVVKVKLDAVPRANLVANVYDVSEKGRALLISRGAHLLRGAVAQSVKLELYAQDWVVPAGHRIGVIISGANDDWWVHVPTFTPVTVASAKIGLPFLTFDRTKFLDGGTTPRLNEYRSNSYTDVENQTIKESQRKFDLPPPLKRRGG
jgi:predicted acyl esterase